MMEYKACPLLVQSDTNPSLMIQGESHTRTYFLRCIGPKCVACENGNFCTRFENGVLMPKRENGGTDDG